MRIIFGLMEYLPIYLYQHELVALLVLLKHVGRNSVLQVFSEILELLGCIHNAFVPCICYLSLNCKALICKHKLQQHGCLLQPGSFHYK